jgi:pimeloyl-ACP methyl ester carboxylesterase
LKEKLTKYHGVKTETLFSSWTDIWLNDEFYSWNIIPMLGGIQCPCLVIQGDNDEFGSIDQVKAIVGKTTGTATPLLLSNIGHSPHIEAPEVTIKQSVDFIERVLIENNID